MLSLALYPYSQQCVLLSWLASCYLQHYTNTHSNLSSCLGQLHVISSIIPILIAICPPVLVSFMLSIALYPYSQQSVLLSWLASCHLQHYTHTHSNLSSCLGQLHVISSIIPILTAICPPVLVSFMLSLALYPYSQQSVLLSWLASCYLQHYTHTHSNLSFCLGQLHVFSSIIPILTAICPPVLVSFMLSLALYPYSQQSVLLSWLASCVLQHYTHSHSNLSSCLGQRHVISSIIPILTAICPPVLISFMLFLALYTYSQQSVLLSWLVSCYLQHYTHTHSNLSSCLGQLHVISSIIPILTAICPPVLVSFMSSLALYPYSQQSVLLSWLASCHLQHYTHTHSNLSSCLGQFHVISSIIPILTAICPPVLVSFMLSLALYTYSQQSVLLSWLVSCYLQHYTHTHSNLSSCLGQLHVISSIIPILTAICPPVLVSFMSSLALYPYSQQSVLLSWLASCYLQHYTHTHSNLSSCLGQLHVFSSIIPILTAICPPVLVSFMCSTTLYPYSQESVILSWLASCYLQHYTHTHSNLSSCLGQFHVIYSIIPILTAICPPVLVSFMSSLALYPQSQQYVLLSWLASCVLQHYTHTHSNLSSCLGQFHVISSIIPILTAICPPVLVSFMLSLALYPHSQQSVLLSWLASCHLQHYTHTHSNLSSCLGQFHVISSIIPILTAICPPVLVSFMLSLALYPYSQQSVLLSWLASCHLQHYTHTHSNLSSCLGQLHVFYSIIPILTAICPPVLVSFMSSLALYPYSQQSVLLSWLASCVLQHYTHTHSNLSSCLGQLHVFYSIIPILTAICPPVLVSFMSSLVLYPQSQQSVLLSWLASCYLQHYTHTHSNLSSCLGQLHVISIIIPILTAICPPVLVSFMSYLALYPYSQQSVLLSWLVSCYLQHYTHTHSNLSSCLGQLHVISSIIPILTVICPSVLVSFMSSPALYPYSQQSVLLSWLASCYLQHYTHTHSNLSSCLGQLHVISSIIPILTAICPPILVSFMLYLALYPQSQQSVLLSWLVSCYLQHYTHTHSNLSSCLGQLHVISSIIPILIAICPPVLVSFMLSLALYPYSQQSVLLSWLASCYLQHYTHTHSNLSSCLGQLHVISSIIPILTTMCPPVLVSFMLSLALYPYSQQSVLLSWLASCYLQHYTHTHNNLSSCLGQLHVISSIIPTLTAICPPVLVSFMLSLALYPYSQQCVLLSWLASCYLQHYTNTHSNLSSCLGQLHVISSIIPILIAICPPVLVSFMLSIALYPYSQQSVLLSWLASCHLQHYTHTHSNLSSCLGQLHVISSIIPILTAICPPVLVSFMLSLALYPYSQQSVLLSWLASCYLQHYTHTHSNLSFCLGQLHVFSSIIPILTAICPPVLVSFMLSLALYPYSQQSVLLSWLASCVLQHYTHNHSNLSSCLGQFHVISSIIPILTAICPSVLVSFMCSTALYPYSQQSVLLSWLASCYLQHYTHTHSNLSSCLGQLHVISSIIPILTAICPPVLVSFMLSLALYPYSQQSVLLSWLASCYLQHYTHTHNNVSSCLGQLHVISSIIPILTTICPPVLVSFMLSLALYPYSQQSVLLSWLASCYLQHYTHTHSNLSSCLGQLHVISSIIPILTTMCPPVLVSFMLSLALYQHSQQSVLLSWLASCYLQHYTHTHSNLSSCLGQLHVIYSIIPILTAICPPVLVSFMSLALYPYSQQSVLLSWLASCHIQHYTHTHSNLSSCLGQFHVISSIIPILTAICPPVLVSFMLSPALYPYSQ